jgi:transcriptional regulator with XRE-family HTH domain
MQKKFTSSSDAAAFLADDPAVKEKVESEINASTLVKALISMRVGKGLSQSEVAKTMGCTPSKISKLEAGKDSVLKWGDVCAYLSAIGMNLSLMFDDSSLPAAERIKQCVFRTHELLEDLAKLAEEVGDDAEITDKIHQFYGEVLFNFVTRFGDSYKRLTSIIKVPGHSDLESTSDVNAAPRKRRATPTKELA